MADNQASVDAQTPEIPKERPRRGPSVGFDEKLAPTCMIWSMIIGIGFFILTALIWGIQHFSQIFT